MNHLRHTLKFLSSYILQGHRRLLQRMLLRLCLISMGVMSMNTSTWADSTTAADNKISAEEAFLQGQQQVEQANIALAELSLTRIPPSSPYAKLLAGNIAAKSGDFDRAFLLLLPLQSNNAFIKAAAASLHASLSRAYEKQGDAINALDQLVRRESYLQNTEAISSNHNSIWQLLSGQSPADLIAMRGESTDTTTQGWIDLSLVAKNPEPASGLTTWANSYPDHVASEFAKSLTAQILTQTNPSQTKPPISLSSHGSIALILPASVEAFAAQAYAFQLGLQAALSKYTMLNEVKIYPSLDNNESFAEQCALAKAEGAAYFITPMSNEAPTDAGTDICTRSPLDADTPASNILRHTGASIRDEAQSIAAFATTNAIQHIVIVATDSESASQMVKSFQAVWQSELGYEVTVITLPHDIKSGDANLPNLKTRVAEQAHDMVLLAMSATEARTIRPYLDISTPTLAFSSVYEITNDPATNTTLNAVRFVDMPFLLDADNSQFAYYHQQSASLKSNDLLRWFALGADDLQLLIANTVTTNKETPGSEVIINGLTGKLMLDKTGRIKRQLSMARFTYDGVVLEK